MAESKIDFSFESLHFSCEGDKDWVEYQLNQVLNRIPMLNNREFMSKPVKRTVTSGTDTIDKIPVKGKQENLRNNKKRKLPIAPMVADSYGNPLIEFLREKDAEKNQVKKFLATAVYLHSQGIEKFSTPMVSKSLKTSRIQKLINASDCLNKNEKKGFCIKNEKEFILTDAGVRSIIGSLSI
jgi:hypothetical protein